MVGTGPLCKQRKSNDPYFELHCARSERPRGRVLDPAPEVDPVGADLVLPCRGASMVVSCVLSF